MPRTDEVLYDNPWLQLKVVKHPENHINGYVYSHEKRCRGEIVSILPYRLTAAGIEFLLRDEITPCWGTDSCVSSITGGAEPGVTTKQCCQHELWEEAGYAVSPSDFDDIHTFRATKSSDTAYYATSVDLTGIPQTGLAEGDGSELEKLATCFWTEDISEAVDPFILVGYYHVMRLPAVIEHMKQKGGMCCGVSQR